MQHLKSSLNAKIGAITLVTGAWAQVPASLLGALAAPWAYSGWLAFSFGALCLCEELVPTRPLNRAGLVLLGAGFVSRTMLVFSTDLSSIIRAEITYALSILIALLFWSAALMHRSKLPKAIGIFGSLLSGGGLVLLIAAHVVVGGAGFFGFGELMAALSHPDLRPDRAMASVSILTALWSSAAAMLMFSHSLQRGS